MNTELEKGILLMRANSTVKGLRLEHLLQGCFVGDEKFWILVRFGEECERIEAGESLAEAYELFVRFCDGEVTPCTARDVAQDFWQEVSQKHRRRA